MAVRYRNTFKSLGGDLYQIDIMDAEYSDEPILFNTGKEGYKISHPSLSQRCDPVFASSCSINFMVETQDQAGFIEEVALADEERFGILIKKNTTTKIWAGIAISDGIEIPDEYFPYPCNLRFIDGLGRLSDKFYNQDGTEYGTPYTGTDTFIAHIVKCLARTGTMQYYEGTDTVLKCVVNWFEVHHLLSRESCPLSDSRLSHSIFYEYDEEGAITFMTVSEVLSMLLQTWNARIFMSTGIYHVVQVQGYTNTTIKSYWFDKNCFQKLCSANDTSYKLTCSTLSRLTGGVKKYLQPLSKIEKTYKYKYSNGASGNLLPVQEKYETPVNCMNNLPCIGGEDIYFSGNLHEWGPVFWPLGELPIYMDYKAQVVLTGTTGTKYYLSGDENSAVWTNTATDYVLIHGTQVNSSKTHNVTRTISFTSAAIPESGSATFQFSFVDTFEFTWDYACEKFSMVVEITNTEIEGDKNFYSFNILTGATQKISIKDSLIGDGPFLFSLGRIEVYDGTVWHNSEYWGVGTPPQGGFDPNAMDINQLSISQNLNGQTVAIEVFQFSLLGTTLSPEKAIIWGGFTLVPIQIDTFPADDMITGRWVNIKTL